MLLDLLAKGYIDKEDLLLKNYKKIGLSENQLVILLLIIHLNQKSLTPKEIANYTNLSDKEVQKELDTMIDSKLIKVSSKNIDLNSLFIKLVQTLENDIDINDNDLIKGLNTIFESKLSVEDVNYLNSEILPKFSKEEILVLASQSSNKNFDSFKQELKGHKPKDIKPITKINWL